MTSYRIPIHNEYYIGIAIQIKMSCLEYRINYPNKYIYITQQKTFAI